MYPNYTMSLGGRFDEGAMLGVTCARIPVKRVIPTILKIIELFKENKGNNDTFVSWINRVVSGNDSAVKSINEIKKIISPLLIPPTKDEDPDFYLDYGSDTSYHTITGKGECAA